MTDQAPRVFTESDIASIASVSPDVVRWITRSRDIQPVAASGVSRLFDEAGVELILHAIVEVGQGDRSEFWQRVRDHERKEREVSQFEAEADSDPEIANCVSNMRRLVDTERAILERVEAQAVAANEDKGTYHDSDN